MAKSSAKKEVRVLSF
ncbi:hypothetical protein RDI58_022480 [Solanum bulbocastanum]|uniref:Uncharacterized protein n=1 Tax=Solanum bulbocastanum TaxID=147425 RepID=A0AAN8Y654_SOLBU